MKTLFSKPTTLLVVLLTVGVSLGAQTLKKDLHKEYSTTSSSELKLDNQFGKITITDWDQNKVVIDVNIEVTSSDQNIAQKLLDKITVDFKEDGNRIIAKTSIDNGNMNNNHKGDKQSFHIDYTVKCPKSIQLSVDNQFGDVIVSSLTGPFNADIQFGALNAVSLTGPDTKIDMQFGKITVGTMNDAKIDIQHSEGLKITDCGNLSLDAQFTHLEIGNLQSLKADLNSSDVTIDDVKGDLRMEINMGSVKIGNVSPSFKSIIVEQNMGDLTIGIDPKAGFNLTAEVNMGSIKVPDGMKLNKEKESEIPGVSAQKVSGTFGNGSSIIKIESNMGSVRIK